MKKNPSPAKPPPHRTWWDSRALVLKIFMARTDFLTIKNNAFVVARLTNAVCNVSQAMTFQDDAKSAVINQLVTLLTCL